MATEFDAQSATKEEALRLVCQKVNDYKEGRETIGVVVSYEAVALDLGVEVSELDAIWEKTK